MHPHDGKENINPTHVANWNSLRIQRHAEKPTTCDQMLAKKCTLNREKAPLRLVHCMLAKLPMPNAPNPQSMLGIWLTTKLCNHKRWPKTNNETDVEFELGPHEIVHGDKCAQTPCVNLTSERKNASSNRRHLPKTRCGVTRSSANWASGVTPRIQLGCGHGHMAL